MFFMIDQYVGMSDTAARLLPGTHKYEVSPYFVCHYGVFVFQYYTYDGITNYNRVIYLDVQKDTPIYLMYTEV